MDRYENLSRDSGVVAYEIGDTSITVEFRDGSQYLYDSVQPGEEAVEEMKRLAVTGLGLATFINRAVRKNYARKLR